MLGDLDIAEATVQHYYIVSKHVADEKLLTIVDFTKIIVVRRYRHFYVIHMTVSRVGKV